LAKYPHNTFTAGHFLIQKKNSKIQKKIQKKIN
jgi:hypothetical protein